MPSFTPPSVRSSASARWGSCGGQGEYNVHNMRGGWRRAGGIAGGDIRVGSFAVAGWASGRSGNRSGGKDLALSDRIGSRGASLDSGAILGLDGCSGSQPESRTRSGGQVLAPAACRVARRSCGTSRRSRRKNSGSSALSGAALQPNRGDCEGDGTLSDSTRRKAARSSSRLV